MNRVKVKAGTVAIFDQIEGQNNMRVSSLGKVWTTRSGAKYQYAYLKWNKLDAMDHSKKAGHLR